MTSKKPAARNYRDAGNGQYVPKAVADRRPKSTVSEPRPTPKKGKGK